MAFKTFHVRTTKHTTQWAINVSLQRTKAVTAGAEMIKRIRDLIGTHRTALRAQKIIDDTQSDVLKEWAKQLYEVCVEDYNKQKFWFMSELPSRKK
jgi:hypothetical protein